LLPAELRSPRKLDGTVSATVIPLARISLKLPLTLVPSAPQAALLAASEAAYTAAF